MAALSEAAILLEDLKYFRTEDKMIVDGIREDIKKALKSYQNKITAWYRSNFLNIRKQFTFYCIANNLKEDTILFTKIRGLEECI